jgi:hypothetical protein
VKRILLALALIGAVTAPGLMPAVAAPPAAPQAFAPLPANTDPAVQQVQTALGEFFVTNHHWPRDLNELVAFAKMRGLPFDLKAFKDTSYGVGNAPGIATAAFAYTLASGARGGFALSSTIEQ